MNNDGYTLECGPSLMATPRGEHDSQSRTRDTVAWVQRGYTDLSGAQGRVVSAALNCTPCECQVPSQYHLSDNSIKQHGPGSMVQESCMYYTCTCAKRTLRHIRPVYVDA